MFSPGTRRQSLDTDESLETNEGFLMIESLKNIAIMGGRNLTNPMFECQ
jgi:hypothetical protein